MEIRKIPVSVINAAPYNPRLDLKPGDSAYEKLKRSITEFGFVEPLVWNQRTGHLVGGHQRMEVLRDLGYQEAEVVVVDLPLEREQTLNLALNKIQGDWDETKLAALLQELTQIPDFDVGLTGFELPEISELFDRQQDQQDDGFDTEAAVASIETPITQPGDLIQLGPHRLLCGDATKPEDLQRLMGDQHADLFDCDWPYNVNYMGGVCPRVDTRPKQSRKWSAIYSDDMPQPEYEAFMRQVLTNVKGHLKPGAAFYQWQAHRQLGPLYQLLTELDFHTACLICWAKESAAISYADYCFQTEQAVYGWLKGAAHYFAGSPGASNLWRVNRDPTQSYQHPCQKPVALAENAIRNSSKRDDIVLDVFLGSGSVLIGAERLKRRCFGLELDPRYCDAIVRRFIASVGKDRVPAAMQAKYSQEVSHGDSSA